MRRGQGNKLQTLPKAVKLTEDMLNLAEVAKAASLDVSTFHRWRRHKRIVIEFPTDCEVVIRLK